MRTLHSALLVSLMILSPLACKREGPKATSPTDSTTARPQAPKMPKPYRLPADPDALVHVDEPKALLEELLRYAPGTSTAPRDAIAQALRQGGRAFEAEVFASIGLGRTWNLAIIDGKTVMHVPVHKRGIERLAAMFAKYQPQGDFGAVTIPRQQGDNGPKVAFLDRDNGMLTLADDLRGIATGPELGRAYGKKGVDIRVSNRNAAQYGLDLGVRRVAISGSGVDKLRIEVEGAPPIPPEARITEGALTGLLESDQIAVGVSSKYVDYKKEVDSLIRQGQRQVSSLPSIAQGNGKELLGRARSMLRTWNGRSMVGVGPANHVLVGLGAADPEKMGNATTHLIRGVMSNIKTVKSLRSFGVKLDVPTVAFAPNKAKVGNATIHVVALANASRYVPPEARPLLTDNNRLRIAMAFPKKRGAGMLVIGRNADTVLAQWLEDTSGGTSPAKSEGHLASGTVAVGPKAIQKFLESEFDPLSVLSLNANRSPTKLVVKRNEDKYVINVRRASGGGSGPASASP